MSTGLVQVAAQEQCVLDISAMVMRLTPICSGPVMLKYLIPQIAWKDLPWMLAMAALGAVLAGAYGVVHDQVTYTISPEYFTKLKFAQFRYADWDLGQRVYVGTIGFWPRGGLAGLWLGFLPDGSCLVNLAARLFGRSRQALP